VSDALGQSLGPAADVCLNAMLPTNCPSGALVYGYGGNPQAWLGGASIPQACWIWRADVTPTGQAAPQVAVFEKTFDLGSGPTGTMQISVDDFAEVFANQTSVGSIGSVSDIAAASSAQDSLTTIDLTPALRAGENTITVVGQNGPYGCGSSAGCSYSRDPAGVVFAGTLRW
jgi:hypothetical protein